MARLTAHFAAAKPDDIAVVDEYTALTWRSFNTRVNRLIHALAGAGLAPGDAIAVVLSNRREWFEVATACAHGGWTYVPVNWHWVGDEIAYVLQDAGVAAVLADQRTAAPVAAALRDPRGAALRLVLGIDAPGGDGLGALTEDRRFAAYEDFLSAAPEHEPDQALLGAPMFYTSGTTGRPKGVRGGMVGRTDVPSDMLAGMAQGFTAMIPAPGRTLLCGPFYHSAQWAFSFFPFMAGSSVIIQHKYDSAEVLSLIDQHDVTNVHLVPTQMKRLLDLAPAAKAAFKGDSLTTVWHGAAACPPAVKRGMIEWWGPKISEYYGSTEGSIVSTITSLEWLERGGSVGKPSPMIDVMVIKDDGSEAAPGETGTLYFRSKMGSSFRYHNDEAKTEAAHLAPGVFTTGDIGRFDADGYLWLSDRKIDMIISGGVNIYPAEIEGVLAAHEAVADVAVIGVPDEEFGEAVKAIVQLKEGLAGDAAMTAELIGHCRTLLAGYKAPRSIDYIDQIPRSLAGKIQKQPLRAPYWAGTGRNI